MEKERVSIFEEETNRKLTSAEKIGASIFWTLTIPILLFFSLMLIIWLVFASTGITS